MLRARLACLAAALALAGCGISNPYHATARASGTSSSSTATTASTSATQSTTAASTTSSMTHAAGAQHDGPPAPGAGPVSPGALAATAQQALARYASLYVNWSAQTLTAHARALAALAVGQARAAALGSAAKAATLARYRVSNSGSVVAIAPGVGSQRGKWAVVTDEQTTGAGPYLGLPLTSHVTWATLEHLKGGYVIAGWYPAS